MLAIGCYVQLEGKEVDGTVMAVNHLQSCLVAVGVSSVTSIA